MQTINSKHSSQVFQWTYLQFTLLFLPPLDEIHLPLNRPTIVSRAKQIGAVARDEQTLIGKAGMEEMQPYSNALQ